MANFGTDISVIPDLNFGLKSGLANLIEALIRRLTTPLGGLFYDPEYGLDLREFVQQSWNRATKFELEIRAVAQCEQDERVLAAEVEATQIDLERIQVKVRGETAEEPFTLILAVSKVSVEVLYANAA